MLQRSIDSEVTVGDDESFLRQTPRDLEQGIAKSWFLLTRIRATVADDVTRDGIKPLLGCN
jgi:hypothetical protein